MTKFEPDRIVERLKKDSIVSPITGCYLWQGERNHDGYGQVWIESVRFQVHRLSASIHLGLDLDDRKQLALHKLECKNKDCWNPEHLYIGSISDNAKDSYKAGRIHFNSTKTHCKRGHEYTPENTRMLKSGSRVCIQCERDRWQLRKITISKG